MDGTVKMKTDNWAGWWFVNGGMIHGLWKQRKYKLIRECAEVLPRRAWDAATAAAQADIYSAGRKLDEEKRQHKLTLETMTEALKRVSELEKALESKHLELLNGKNRS